MALAMACAPTQTEYSQKGKVRSGDAPSIIKLAQKLSSSNHDAATKLNRSPWPSQRPPRLSHQCSTATMTKNAAQVVTSPTTTPKLKHTPCPPPPPPAPEPQVQHSHDDQEPPPRGDQPHHHPQPHGHTGRHCMRSWVQTDQHADERNRQYRLPAGEKQVRECRSFELYHSL